MRIKRNRKILHFSGPIKTNKYINVGFAEQFKNTKKRYYHNIDFYSNITIDLIKKCINQIYNNKTYT